MGCLWETDHAAIDKWRPGEPRGQYRYARIIGIGLACKGKLTGR